MHHYDFEFLRDCRKLSGLTIAELAERAGIHEVTLARIEGGLRCAPDTLKRIVGATIDALDERTLEFVRSNITGGQSLRDPLAVSAADFAGLKEWTPVKLVFDGDAGRGYVEVNGKRNPSLEAVDLSLRFGRVGLGSFDETGDFRRVKITGEPRSTAAVGRQ